MLQGVQNGSVVIYLIRFVVIHFIRTMKEVISTYIGMDKDI